MDTTALVSEIVEGFDPGSVVTKFVVIAEVIDGDGERVLWCDTHAGATRWDTYGLLTFALERERSYHVLDEDDE